jgi:cell division protein FtsI (penicillin-binding protein 3)
MEALRLLDVPKDLPDKLPYKDEKPAPMNDVSLAELSTPAAPLPEVSAEASAPASRPVSFAVEPVRTVAALSLYGPRVPDLQGKTMRHVMEECLAKGLPVEVSGSGIARAQAPPPGSILPPGARVRVVFVR